MLIRNDGERILVLIWVDDILIAARTLELIESVKKTLWDKFKMKDLGEVSTFLGIEFRRSPGVICLSQEQYIISILNRFSFCDVKPRTTPCENNYVENDYKLPGNYREMVGTLVYAMTCTRPDLSFAVTKLSQKLDNPSNSDYSMVKHVFQYLKETLNYSLKHTKYDTSSTSGSLFGYSDSDWGSSVTDRKSITGYYFGMNIKGPAVSWKSKR